MTAEIISIGTELLLGNIIDTNAAFLSQNLAQLGISVFRKTTVGDNKQRLLCAIENAFENADIVITSGGLGPTLDDITKEAAAEYFGRDLYTHEESLSRIKSRFASLGRKIESTNRNAIIPKGAGVFQNDNGSAPGVLLEQDGKIMILLPGPPSEMRPMFTDYVVPFLAKKSDSVLTSCTLKIIGIGESQVETALLDLIQAQTNPTIAPYAKDFDVHVRITASAKSEEEAQVIMTPVLHEIRKRLGTKIYSETDATLPEIVLRLLREKKHTIATAESCTGGLVVSELIAIAGCSDIVHEGVVTYSNHAKVSRLAVCPDIIATHGAVSMEVAGAMASGACAVSGASVGLSTTGIAGPGGGTADKPVGLVYIGVCVDGNTQVIKYNTIGNRNEIRIRAAYAALDALRLVLV